MGSSLVMRRLSRFEPKKRVRVVVRLEEELVDALNKNSLNASDISNIGIEKELVNRGYLPCISVRVDPQLLLDPEVLTTIQDNNMNVSTILNTGARILLREKGLLA